MRLLTTTLATLLLLAASADAGTLVGVAAPLSGPSAILGKQIENGAVLAAETGGVAVRTVDDACTADGGAAAAREFVAAKVDIVVGFLCTPAIEAAQSLPDDLLGVFLLIARAAREGLPCPDDEEIARTYGTSSLGRARRVVGYMEARDIIVTRTDLSGRRSITLPGLGWTTAVSG